MQDSDDNSAVETSAETGLATNAEAAAEPSQEPEKKKTWQRTPPGPTTPWGKRQVERAATDPNAEAIRLIRAIAGEGPDAIKKFVQTHVDISTKYNFYKFAQRVWHVVEPATTPQWNWHHELICLTLQALLESWLKAQRSLKEHTVQRGGQRAVIGECWIPPVTNTVLNCPPGSLKSRLISVFFPAWCWIRAPEMKIIALSVNEDAAMRDARAMRDIVKSDWYQSTFCPEWRIRDSQDAISNFGNTASGERISKASGSEIVGQRADLILGDDLNNPLESFNETERDKVNFLWDTNQYNRVNDSLRSLRVCVQQRTNFDDHTGHVLAKQGVWAPDNRAGWLHVVLPAEYDPARRFALPDDLVAVLREVVPAKALAKAVLADPRAEKGETLDKVRMTPRFLADERKRWLGTSNYANQMLQLPQLEGGDQLQKAWLSWARLERRDGFDDVAVVNGLRPSGCRQADECPALLIPAKNNRYGWDFDWVCISLDAANQKTNRGSNWGLLVIGGKGGRRFVLDDRTRKGDILEILEVIRELGRLWKPDLMLIERKAAGDSMRRMLEEEIAKGSQDFYRMRIEVVDPGADGKEKRLETCKYVIANGMVHFLDGASWLEECIDELAAFPNGKNDDRVDALTQVLNFAADTEAGGDWFDDG